ncbi:hypothetical protein R70006_06224 [Paraburkholderia domus]|uniref:hypothetical protein n=1 Tax=Paraburkholderia domus TaxID=2793075 RepID=UPI0019144BE6|nr:hypothetical protein [Paraburkholderia domus]MBK5052855.1 hypothetical protein [Burkholderia sp. R-70006]CAE6821550.1 hypothetical protein R70006_06224 [Paraburkholderia domus]
MNDLSAHDLRVLLDGGFDTEAYWRDRPSKKWVVEVTKKRGGQIQHQTMYVGAATNDGAARTARANTLIRGRVSTTVRLATPRDLGATANKGCLS